MARKRYIAPERNLTTVLQILQKQPGSTRVALHILFGDGPLLANDFGIDDASDDDLQAVRVALLQQVRWLVTRPDTPLWWNASTLPTFGLVMHQRQPVIGLKRPAEFSAAALLDAARLIFMFSAREAGLANVAACAALDCENTFIRFHKREYCSPRCQKRAYMQQRRENERVIKARRRRRLRLVQQQKRRA